MAKTSVELREERATIIANARAKYTDAEAREGGSTNEDEVEFERALDAADVLGERAKRLERLEVAEVDLDAPGERRSGPVGHTPRGGDGSSSAPTDRQVSNDYRHWLRTGEIRSALRPDQDRVSRLPAELRDTVISTDAKGGYLITPTKVSEDIVRQIDDAVYLRTLATITRLTEAKKSGIRKRTTRMADADWTTEVAAVTEDTTMAFGLRELEPYLSSKLSKVSIRTLMLAADAEAEVNGELAYKFGITQEKAFLTGDGSSKPLGAYVASASGISTGRDVAAAAATSFTADNLIDMKFNLKEGYQRDPSTRWIVSRTFVKMARKLKVASSGGNDLEYLWQPGLTEGAPDRILDIPYHMSEFAPATFTTGLYVAVLGAWRYYRIVELADLMIQRLVERYADTNEVGFIGRQWVDGAPVLEEAFTRLKLA
jgi:HK97 family phage major capsid protein